MPPTAPTAPGVPADAHLRCEACGYALRGLPPAGNCPECGRPVARSRGGHRRPAPFEVAPSAGSFLRTTRAVLFRPARFFGSLSARPGGGGGRPAVWFARVHRAAAALLLAAAAAGHVILDDRMRHGVRAFLAPLFRPFRTDPDARSPDGSLGWLVESTRSAAFSTDEPVMFVWMAVPLAAATYLLIAAASRLAAVRRGLGFHAAHLVPAALLPAATVCGYIWWAFELGGDGRPPLGGYSAWPPYRHAMAAQAVLCPAYLLATGRVAVARMRYANDPGGGDGG